MGWRIDGITPTETRCVLIAAPHTSNWDFPLMLLYAASFRLKISWLAKHSLFTFPLGWLMRRLGGIPVYRHQSGNLVEALVERFESQEHFVLVVPAEGTRDYTQFWKSGWYHIARGANVPVLPTFLDYLHKRGGFASPLHPTGDLARDMEYLRAVYAPMQGLHAERFGPVRLREENN